MPVVASDLVVYGALNIAEDNSSAQGGGINTQVRYVFDDASFVNSFDDTVGARSSRAEDTQTLAIYGRNTAGVIVSGIMALSGTTPVFNHVSFERILKVKTLTAHNGSVTISGVTNAKVFGVMESGVNEIRRAFYNSAADVSGGSERDFYEKVFVKNNNTTNALLDAVISESGDPTGKVTFALASGINDTQSIASRLNTAPTFITLDGFSNSNKNVVGTNLLPGSGQAVWLKLNLAAGSSPTKSTWTIGINGNTT